MDSFISENNIINNHSEICDEATFNWILVLERKRAERSKRKFMLALFSFDKDRHWDHERERVCASLASSIRDIDALGWYKESTIGVIFTEIGDAASPELTETILRRVTTQLSTDVGTELINHIDISVFIYPDNISILQDKLPLYPDVEKFHSSQKGPLLLKRVIDVVGSLTAMVLFSPLFIIISLLIKINSEGPVFFRQQRLGLYGKHFTVLKFRTMYVNNDPTIHRQYVKSLITSSETAGSGNNGDTGGVYKIVKDPRVTLIGNFLRRTSLDELPQFINVLVGEMSLVGPRPPLDYEVENYEPWHNIRVLEMKPGITGLWQVTGRSRTTFNDMVRLDIQYMANWSIWLDFKLLWMTPKAVLGAKGAY